mmetsp:Transcript_25098/g.59060  ORF Transcript_25098/g.59060 Transcript_25098/m.59060 type:complete len:407 (-) Transcript_25098:226-1446(-)
MLIGKQLGVDVTPPALLVLPAAGGPPAVLPLAPWDSPESSWEVPQSGGFAAGLYGHPGAITGASTAAHRLGAHLAEWADAHSLPLLLPYSDDFASRIFGTRAAFHALAIHAPPAPPADADVHQDIVGSGGHADSDAPPGVFTESVHANLVGAFGDGGVRGTFVLASLSAAEHPDLAEYLGIRMAVGIRMADGGYARSPDLPALAVLHPSTGRKWVLPLSYSLPEGDGGHVTLPRSAVSRAEISGWLASIRFGSLAPALRSAPSLTPPPELKPGKITEIVGTDYEAVLLDDRYHTLLYVHAPWCGHCARFDKTMAEVAEDTGHVPTIALARLDGTANELPGLPVGAYPSLFLFSKGGKSEPVEYTGMRSRLAIVHWLVSELGDEMSYYFQKGKLQPANLGNPPKGEL